MRTLQRVPPWGWDGLLALVLLGAAAAQLATPYTGPRPFIRGGGIALLQHALVLLPLILRRRFPFAVLLFASVASAAGPLFEIRDTTAQAFGTTLLGYSVVAHSRSLWRSVVGAAIVAAVYWQHINPFVAPWAVTWWNFTFLALVLYAGFIQYRRLQVSRELRAKKVELEAQQEGAAERTVVAERAKIASELHAVVTRAVGQMVESATRAAKVLSRKAGPVPDLRGIEAAGRDAVADMRRLLGVLKRGAERRGSGVRSEAASSRGTVDRGEASGQERASGDGGLVPPLYPSLRLPALPLLIDLALAAVLTVGVLGELALIPPEAFGPYASELKVAALAVVGGILLRRLIPLPVVLAQCATLFWFRAQGVPTPFAAGTAILTCLYVVGAYRRMHEGLIGALAAMAVSLPALTAPAADGATYGQTTALWISIGWSLWLGWTARRTEELNNELAATVAEIERNQQEEVRVAALQERARIAREMHDVVAHSVSLMTVQAGAARSVAESDRKAACHSLQAIETSGREALAEMESIVDVLRGADAPPSPRGLEDLPDLVRDVKEAGVDAELHLEGDSHDVGEALSLSAYRIVQEALTNVRKHAGDATARVVVRRTGDTLELEIVDDGAPAAASVAATGSGHGLVGIRERASMFDGEVRAGPGPQGGFEVRARLPLRDE